MKVFRIESIFNKKCLEFRIKSVLKENLLNGMKGNLYFRRSYL